MMKSLRLVLLLFITFLVPLSTTWAAAINDSAALGDLKQGKGVFLVDIGDPKKLAFYLEIIAGTHANLERQGVQADFVVVYIGPSVKYLTSAPGEDIEFELSDVLTRIAEATAQLGKLGVRQEICAVATKVFGIDNKTVLPDLTLVGDGFVSLIGWQAQGYHLVPVY